MVNLLSPSQNKPSTMEEPETTQTVSKLTEAESTIASNKKNCWVSIVRPLAGLRKLLAGPPMTEQERTARFLPRPGSEMLQVCTGSTGPLFRVPPNHHVLNSKRPLPLPESWACWLNPYQLPLGPFKRGGE
jgi:hypothetical protein